MNVEQKLEALLFFKGEPISIKHAAEALLVSESDVQEAVEKLQTTLLERGIRLMRKDDEITLGTGAEMGELIESIRKEELSRDIGKAGLETLSIILYKGPVSRSDIDYIRGVNSSYIIRNLLIRALIERVPNPSDSRSYLYRGTFELLSFLGITHIEDLPDFGTIREELASFVRGNPPEQSNLNAQEENRVP